MKERDTYVDVAKGICMLLIIYIHTEVFGVIGMPLTFIAVPMFFFMSGFNDRSEKPFAQWIEKSFKTLLIPAIVWCGIGFAYINLLSYVKSGSVAFAFDINAPCIGNGPAWFLLSLFYTRVIIGLLVRLRLPRYAVFAICLGLGYLGSEYQMPLNVDEALAAVPLYYLGKQFYPCMKKLVNQKTAFLGLVTLMIFLFTPYYYNIGPRNPLFHPYYLLAMGGDNCIFVHLVCI